MQVYFATETDVRLEIFYFIKVLRVWIYSRCVEKQISSFCKLCVNDEKYGNCHM